MTILQALVTRADLYAATSICNRFTDAKSDNYVFSMFHLQTKGSDLTISATGGGNRASAVVPMRSVSAGRLCVNGRAFHQLVERLPDGEVTLLEEDGWLRVAAAGARYSFLANQKAAAAFPPEPEVFTASRVFAHPFREILWRTLPAACKDETRIHLNGVFLEFEAGLMRGVATDGHRLILATQVNQLTGPIWSAGAILERAPALALLHVLEGATGTIDLGTRPSTSRLQINHGRVRLHLRLIDATFPSYRSVIPTPSGSRTTMNRLALVAALNRLAWLANDTRGVIFELDDGAPVRLRADNADVGDGVEVVAGQHVGRSIHVGVNPRFLLEALGTMSAAEVAVETGGPLDPLLLTPATGTDHLAVIMPMRT